MVAKKNKGGRINNLITETEIVEAARVAKDNGANEFSIVTSGTCISNKDELNVIANAVKKDKK